MVMTKAQLYNPRNNPARKLPNRATLSQSLTGNPAPRSPETLFATTTSASFKPTSRSSLASGEATSLTGLLANTPAPLKPSGKTTASPVPPTPLLSTLITTGAVSKPPQQGSLPGVVPPGAGGEPYEAPLPLSDSDQLPPTVNAPTPPPIIQMDVMMIRPELINSLIQQMISFTSALADPVSALPADLPAIGMVPTLVQLPH